MKVQGQQLVASATDLANFMGCRHATQLDRQVAAGKLEKPYWHNPVLDALSERGELHEQAYLQHLKNQGASVVEFDKDASPDDVWAAMGDGPDYIYQARLQQDTWIGYADFLCKVASPSALGNWRYEVLDAKLARETRGETILQLCVYSELITALQGCAPENAYVLTPGEFEPERYRLADYMAYYRLVKRDFLKFIERDSEVTYPEPVDKCDRCRWFSRCNVQRRGDDHLSFVAGIQASQRQELARQGITTLQALAELPLPLPFRPERGSKASLEKMREQARLQYEARETKERQHEVLPLEADQGLHKLPAPSPGDVYFDIEGARFVGEHGFEYLFGFAAFGPNSELVYEKELADSPAEEARIFGAFMERMDQIQKTHPNMHIYHFHSYEPSALKRLACRYARHEDLLDDMLRHERFVDLHSIARHTVRASVERYSIKDLEPFFGYEREMDLHTAGDARHELESWLEFNHPMHEAPEEQVQIVIEYNRDDCLATHGLHQWMEDIRGSLIEEGQEIPRYVATPEISEDLKLNLQELRDLGESLREGLPERPEDFTPEDRARWLLSHLLEFYRREDKSVYWEKFRLDDLDDLDRMSERAAISGLTYQETLERTKTGIPIERYTFPLQEITIKPSAAVYTDKDTQLGSVVAIDHERRTVDIKKMGRTKELVPTSIFTWQHIGAGVLEDAIKRLAERVLAGNTNEVALALLQRHLPRLQGGETLAQARQQHDNECVLAENIVKRLDRTVLPIQGPPGTGKTHTGARMILAAIAAGKKVGVTAQSHKVILNLLHKVLDLAQQDNIDLRIVRKPSSRGDESGDEQHPLIESMDNDAVEAAIRDDAHIAAGTAWLWARQGMADTVDVLFIDEAGQFSLANTCAVAQAADSLVMLGDPQQLDQPLQGIHPDGAAASGLQHVLDDHATMPSERGLFLPETWRMHPNICSYISEMFYEDRLTSVDQAAEQALLHSDFPERTGLWFIPIEHAGNQNASTEEAAAVAGLYAKLLNGGKWRDSEGGEQFLTPNDILVVTPYNAQLGEIKKQNPSINVGTVDKFQGQEAPVVIVSYATSTPEDAPRGMDFLYSLNRLNVAVSRARCATFVLASPALLRPECRKPTQMKLANGLARYVEHRWWGRRWWGRSKVPE